MTYSRAALGKRTKTDFKANLTSQESEPIVDECNMRKAHLLQDRERKHLGTQVRFNYSSLRRTKYTEKIY